MVSKISNNQYLFLGWHEVDYVSLNNGVFLCFNCATGIHLEQYPSEVSFIKSINNRSGIGEDEFNYLQLRVLINGGNKAAFDFYEQYDLANETVQKKYSTVAAQYYRDRLRKSLEGKLATAEGPQPSWEDGRAKFKTNQAATF